MNEKVKSFLKENNIELINEKPTYKEKINIKFYIEKLSEVHDVFLREKNIIQFKFPSDTWKMIQSFKLWNNRVSRIENNNELFKLINYCSKKTIESIESINYRNLILRAMKNNEVCVRKIYFNNEEDKSKVAILETEKLAFRMIEDDYYECLKRLRGEMSINLDEIIHFALEQEQLGEESFTYIKFLLMYPYNSMKYLQNIYLKASDVEMEKLNELAKKDFLI